MIYYYSMKYSINISFIDIYPKNEKNFKNIIKYIRVINIDQYQILNS
jgi:hypothetical protein